MKKIFFIILTFISILSYSNSMFPKIDRLSTQDIFFKQLEQDLKLYYFATKNRTKYPKLQIYRYTPKKDSTIYQVSSSFSLPYEAIATLNRINYIKTFDGKTTILIPNQPGVFIYDKANSELEYIIKAKNDKSKTEIIYINGKKIFFSRDRKFSDIERSYFLGLLNIFPVPGGRISSGYGLRNDPFTGDKRYHKGIDIAAPLNSNVIAPKYGKVVSTGRSKTYGNYIMIKHQANFTTFYAHLNKILVKKGDKIKVGEIIGKVGQTGRATGPHLHFEVRKDGQTLNPEKFIKIE